jgi:putative mRNA 3-end processing factor
VRLQHAGRVWVASGDYYLSAHDERNPTCEPFEPQRCDCFITESTFGLPVYRWQPQSEVFAEINTWWRANAAAGRPSLLMAYSFGKAQRLLAGVDAGIGPIVVHGAVAPLNAAYRAAGVALPEARTLAELADLAELPEQRALADRLAGALVVAPPSVHASAWARKLGDFSDGFASGWMALRGARRRQGVDRGFVLSDHADWPGLQRAIKATGAERVIVTHGQEAVMVRWLREQGLQADSFSTEYGVEGGDGPSEGASAPVGATAQSADVAKGVDAGAAADLEAAGLTGRSDSA